MKTRLLILYLFFPSLTFCQFRGIDWGTTISQAKKSEQLELYLSNDKILIYKGKLSTYDVTISYFFEQGLLRSGMYSLEENYVNDNNYIAAFEDLKSQLTIKYADPSEDRLIWKNNLYRDDPDRYGMAISAGHLEYRTIWNIDGTRIGLTLSGENYECELNIIYADVSALGKKEAAEGL